MSEEVEVAAATERDVEEVAPLFDAYRVWYGAESDLNGARNFVMQRLRNDESVVFLAKLQETPVGFTQLYPSFSSVSLAKVWLLNDLYVAESYRSRGIGTLLLETAAEFGRQLGAIRLQLQTGIPNTAAQSVYAAHGWVRDEEFYYYSLPLG